MKDDASRPYDEFGRIERELAEIEARRAHLLTRLKVLHAAHEDPWFEFLLRSTFRGWFARQPPRHGRSTTTRDQLIAAHSFLLELELQSTEAAVGAVMNIHAVRRSTVFAARKRWQELRGEMDRVPDRRREIELFEQFFKQLYQSN